MTTKIKAGVIGDGVVGTTQIADDAITSAKLDTNIAVAGTLTVTGDITGTLATAAQPNITSVGTLTALTGGTGDLNWDSGTLFVDSSANSVGIGTSLPDADLHVEGVTRTKYLRFQNLTDATSEVAGMYSSSGGGTNDLSIYASALSSTSSNIKFLTAPTNSATTTTLFLEGSSGNVGIGTSSPSNYYTGADNLVVYQATGEVGMTIATGNSSVGALYFADGTTGVDEYKGGIAYEHSADLLSLVSGGATKIRIDATGNTYPNVNASWDLGKTTSRFKDLYLSGTASVGHVIPNTQGTYSINHLGVYSGGITVNAATSQTGYLMSAGTGIVGFGPNGGSIRLGGTAAANELDDYEEGTWTPASSASLSVSEAVYTRIGRSVTIIADITFGSLTSTTAAAISLPFAGSIASFTAGAMNYTTYTASAASVNIISNSIHFRSTAIQGANMSYTEVSGKRFIFTATYFTSA